MAEGMVGGEGMGSGGISDVGVLDLTGMKSAEEVAGITTLSQVATTGYQGVGPGMEAEPGTGYRAYVRLA